MSDDFKRQRDQFIAFALAAADLLVELGPKGEIKQAIGATQALLGAPIEDLIKRNFADFFQNIDQVMVKKLIARARKYGRVPLTRTEMAMGSRNLLLNLGATIMPSLDGSVFVTLAVVNEPVLKIDMDRDAVTGLMSQGGFQRFAEQALVSDEELAPKQMKLVRLSGLTKVIETMPEEQTRFLMSEVAAVLRSNALGGFAAGQIADDVFSILPDPKARNLSDAELTEELVQATEAGGAPKGAVKAKVSSVDVAVTELADMDMTRALAFVLNEFSRSSVNPITSLKEGLKLAYDSAVQGLEDLRAKITQQQFQLYYQPVVDLKSRKLHHYEALLRFRDGRSPFETVRMSEKLGLLQELDSSVLDMAIKTLMERPDMKVAVNMSGDSVQSDAFRERLRVLVAPHKELATRLMFELTESSDIVDMDSAANFLKWLRRGGFEVALDDFGAGAAAYAYLRRFDVDYVKIDGPFIREALKDKRQRALINSVCVLCRELGSGVVGEMIEDEATTDLCLSLGIQYGQGYFFGRPIPEIETRPFETLTGRRVGEKEVWR